MLTFCFCLLLDTGGAKFATDSALFHRNKQGRPSQHVTRYFSCCIDDDKLRFQGIKGSKRKKKVFHISTYHLLSSTTPFPNNTPPTSEPSLLNLPHSQTLMELILSAILAAASVVVVAWAAHDIVEASLSVEDMETLPMIQHLCRERISMSASRNTLSTHTK